MVGHMLKCFESELTECQVGAFIIFATLFYLYKRNVFKGPIGNLDDESPEDVVKTE